MATQIRFSDDFTGRAARLDGGEVYVLIDARSREVRLWRGVGPGVPADVWHGRVQAFRIRESDTALEDVREILSENDATEIASVFAHWQGEHWDGHHYVGRWGCDSEARDRVERIVEDLADDVRERARRYSDAEDWLGAGKADVLDELLDALDRHEGDLDAAVEARVVEEASLARDEALLEEGEIESVLRAWAEQDAGVQRRLRAWKWASLGLQWRALLDDQGESEHEYALHDGVLYRRCEGEDGEYVIEVAEWSVAKPPHECMGSDCQCGEED